MLAVYSVENFCVRSVFSVRVWRTVVCVALSTFKSAEKWAWQCLCVFVVRFVVAGMFGGCT